MRALLAVLGAFVLVAGCSRTVSPAVRERIVQDFQAGKFKPDSRGVVLLPSDLAATSIGGRTFVTTNQTALWLLFRTWKGKAANMTGYLYAPGAPLKPGSEVTLTTDNIGVIVSAESTVEKALGGGWYIVHRGYD
jgi:hypothetical protein